MRIATWMGLSLVVLLSAQSVSAKELSGSDRRKLAKAFAAYVREPDADKRDDIWKPVARLAKGLSFEEIESLVAEAVPGDEWKRGFTHDVEFESAGETWTYSVHLPRKRPDGLLPLVVDAGHTSLADGDEDAVEDVMSTWLSVSGAEGDVISMRTRVLDKLANDGRYDEWSRPRKPAGDPSLDTIASILMDAIRDAALRYPVDPNRIYVQGISQTGYWAWWLGAYAPDRFAGVVPVASVTWHVRRLLPSLSVTPVFILHGELDQTCPFAQAKGAAEDLENMGAPVDFRPVADGEHVRNTFPKWATLWPDVAEKTRAPHPITFEKLFLGPERPGAFWLWADELDEPEEFNPFAAFGRLKGTIDEQTIEIEAKGCEKIRVYLATPMLDLEKRITIEVNGDRAYRGKVKPDARAALDRARELGDGVAYSAVVEVDVD